MRKLQQGLRLGRERQPLRVACDIQGLNAQAVTANQQAAAHTVPKRECKHPVQAVDEILAICNISVKQNFAIRTGLEVMSEQFKFTAKFDEVINFSVAHKPEAIILTGNRLMSTGDIDNGEPAHADSARSVEVHSFVIRPAVR